MCTIFSASENTIEINTFFLAFLFMTVIMVSFRCGKYCFPKRIIVNTIIDGSDMDMETEIDVNDPPPSYTEIE